jgi:hypothetical protein
MTRGRGGTFDVVVEDFNRVADLMLGAGCSLSGGLAAEFDLGQSH